MCTVFAERNLVNRRNVKTDTHHSYAANKQMFLLSVKSLIVVAAMQVLGLETIDGMATTLRFSPNTPKDIYNKQKYINKIASLIVDMFIVEKDSTTAIINFVVDERDQEVTVDGRFQCRHPGCPNTFKQLYKILS